MREVVKVSVLMSVYNPNGSYLLQAVQSMIDQTMREWEMIVYNDGSDPSFEPVIREAAGLDARIHYIRGEQNLGLAHALNAGLKIAKGNYIARMDADDISKPDRIQKLYDFLESHLQYQWAGSNTELIDDGGVWGRWAVPEIPHNRDFLKYSPYIHPSVMFRREVLIDSGGYRELRRGEDYELFMRLHARGKQGFNLQELLFAYREDADTYKRRTYRYQMEEVKIRFEGFRSLGFPMPGVIFSVCKPLIVGLLPHRLLMYIKSRIRKERYVERYERDKA